MTSRAIKAAHTPSWEEGHSLDGSSEYLKPHTISTTCQLLATLRRFKEINVLGNHGVLTDFEHL